MIEIYKFITDCDGGTNCTVFTDRSEALEALYSFALGAGYTGLKSERLIDDWREDQYQGIDTFYIEAQELASPQLDRAHSALRQCVTALDLNDQFGDDIDARHTAEEEAYHNARAVLKNTPTPRKHFLVKGRFQYDRQDSWNVFECGDVREAVSLWKSWMHSEFPDNKNKMYVDDTWVSDAPITGEEIYNLIMDNKDE